MKKRTFVIPSLALAGFTQPLPAEIAIINATSGAGGKGPDSDGLFQRFRLDHAISLAQHRSHSSHASHGSHRSGSTGQVRTPPPPRTTPPAPPQRSPAPAPRTTTRNQRSTPPSSVLPSSPAIAPAVENTPIQNVVRRVQLALQALGYYTGKIDGISGPQTRAALVRYQTDYHLNVTGTVTPEVLDALRIMAE